MKVVESKVGETLEGKKVGDTNGMPAKVSSVGYFCIHVSIGEGQVKGLLDLGANVNVMSSSMYETLGLKGIKPSEERVLLADGSMKQVRGVLEDQVVFVDACKVSVDFMVIDVKESRMNKEEELLLGKPFLATVGAEIDVRKRRLKMNLLGNVLEYEGLGASTRC